MKPGKISLFFACIIIALAIICACFPSDGVTVGGHSFYLPSIHSLAEANKPAPEVDPEEERMDSMLLAEAEEITDSIVYIQAHCDSSDTRFWLPDSTFFDAFWAAAEGAADNDRVVRVMHYGDSQIEMDRMSAQLRAYMQATFGGGGPGMIPYRTIIPTYAVRQSTSGNLVHLSSFGDSTVTRSRGNYGPMMQCFRMDGQATLTIKASTHSSVDNAVKQFSRVMLVFNNRGEDLRLNIDNKEVDTAFADSYGSPGVGAIDYRTSTPQTYLRLRTTGSADLYCVTVDDGPGVAVDNIPMRGCSGQQFTLVNRNLLTQAYDILDVGMIIMQFGGNSVPYLNNKKSITTYCQSIGRQIDYVRSCCPRAKILFIGPSDMSTRVKDALQTYPSLPTVIDSLIATVTRHGAAYWSIYHAMGGWNSMVEWNRKGLAGSDYVHFTPHGAQIMGTRLAEAFADNYQLYCLRRRLKENAKEQSPQ